MLARGGLLPVLTPALIGIGCVLIGMFVDPLYGFAPGCGALLLILSVFFAQFWRDPDRPIPKDPGIIVSPADGHVMFVRREKAVGRRPSNSEKNQIERDE